MKDKKFRIGIAFLGLTLIVVLVTILLTKPLELYAGNRIFHGETATYSYSGKVMEHTGDVVVSVYYLRGGEKAIEAYREANTKRNYVLLAQKEPKLTWVQVTFVRPIPTAEVSALVKETGFKVEDFLLAGRNSQGGKAWCIDGTGNLDKPFCDDPNLGVMILKGWVETTEQGLGRWMADERVYMIDTVAAEIMEILAQKHPDIVAGRELIGPKLVDGKKYIIVIPESPLWELEW